MEKLNIKGFKCFGNTDIYINDMTVLVGANGYGKSSTIQALLLFKQAVDSASYVNLNGAYGLELGEVIDIINQNYSEPKIIFSLTNERTRENSTECHFYIEDRNEELTLNFTFPTEIKNEKLKQKEFYYVSAERIGPRFDDFHLQKSHGSAVLAKKRYL